MPMNTVVRMENQTEKASEKRRTRTKKEQKSNPDLRKHLQYMIPKVSLALIREPGMKVQTNTISCPKDILLFLEPLKTFPEEHFGSLHLNAKNQVVGYQEISHGTISASLVSPREVFKAAILSNSFALLVAHNHPSGAQLSPSKEDLETTRQLLKAGKILGITVLDHVIVGDDEIYSIRENHPRIWDESFSQLG